jgi:hypothetical protein
MVRQQPHRCSTLPVEKPYSDLLAAVLGLFAWRRKVENKV